MVECYRELCSKRLLMQLIWIIEKKIEPATIQYWSNHTAKKFIQFNDTFVDPMLYTATVLFHSSAIAVQD